MALATAAGASISADMLAARSQALARQAIARQTKDQSDLPT